MSNPYQNFRDVSDRICSAHVLILFSPIILIGLVIWGIYYLATYFTAERVAERAEWKRMQEEAEEFRRKYEEKFGPGSWEENEKRFKEQWYKNYGERI